MVLAAVPLYLRERRAAESELNQRPGFTPPLTLLKPLAGAEPDLEAHIESFFEQDYPTFEILFCARQPNDAGLEIARRVAARYPQVPTMFMSTGEPPYINAKVASMELMEKSAAHDILVISDSDVRVTPNYLRAVALPFVDEKVGAMCCPYRGIAAGGGLWARLEAVGMSVEMTAGVLVARMMEGMQFVLGPTMAFRRCTIRQIGGFKVTADYCADDFVLGNEAFKLGQTGLLGLSAGLFLGHALWGVAFLAWAIASREALSIAVGRMVVRDPSWFNLLVLYPVRDLMGFFFWASSYVGSKILWRGQVFQLLPGGKMRAAK
jgi:ceramide glucosyltransferase